MEYSVIARVIVLAKKINFYDKGINYNKNSLSSIRDKIVHRVQYVKQWTDSVDSKIKELEVDHVEFDTDDPSLKMKPTKCFGTW